MMLGKAISLFLIDTSPTGRIAAELHNWTGKAHKIPRNQLKESSDRVDLQKAGVYFLFGRDERDPDMFTIYVGEAEEVYKRLIQHQSKDFWHEALVFTSKDENLNKAHVKFLEAKSYSAISKAKRATLKNDQTPTEPMLSELEQSVMLEYFENLKLLASTLGYNVMEPIVQKASKQRIYLIKAARGASAKAVLTSEGITVLEQSHATLDVTPSADPWVGNARDRLIESGVLKLDGNVYSFTRDYSFSSPSTAAGIVMGRNANGRAEWKDSKGISIKDNEPTKP